MNTVSVDKIVFNGFTLFVVADKVTIASCNVTGRFISKKLACAVYAQYKFFKDKKAGEFVTMYAPKDKIGKKLFVTYVSAFLIVLALSLLLAFLNLSGAM